MGAGGKPAWVGSACYRVRGETGYAAFALDGETYRIGDTVMLKACDGNDEDFVARIEGLWEDKCGDKWLEARWFYRPEDTRQGRLRRHHRREVFESTHTDTNTLDTVQCKCAVLSWEEYRTWAAQPAATDTGSDDDTEVTFVCRARYNTLTHDARPLPRAPGSNSPNDGVATAELPLLTDPSEAPGGAGGEGAQPAQAPLHSGRRVHNPFADARSCLLLNAPPDRLPCREAEREKVLRWMRAAVVEGGSSSPLYVSGVPGTGKTATVREVCRALRAEELRGEVPPFVCAEVNGMRLPAPSFAYSLLWELLSGQSPAPPPARALPLLESHFANLQTSRPAVRGRARAAGMKRTRQGCLVLIADELDYLVTRNQSVLYNLFEWSARPSSRLALVGISNTVDLPERLLPRLSSRMGLARVPFLPYSHSDLSHILQARLGAIPLFDGPGLELASRRVASVSGDVRRALEICRRATELAEAKSAAAATGATTKTFSTDARARAEAAAGRAAASASPSTAAAAADTGPRWRARTTSEAAGAGPTLSTPARPARGTQRGDKARQVAAGTTRGGGGGGEGGGGSDDGAEAEPCVVLDDIDAAIRHLNQTAPLRLVRLSHKEEHLLLAAAAAEAERTGRADVPLAAVHQRYRAACATHGAVPMPHADVEAAVERLCLHQLLVRRANGHFPGDEAVRLGVVQSEDLRLVLQAQDLQDTPAARLLGPNRT